MGLPEQDDTPLLPQFWSSCVGGKTEGPILGPVDLRFSLFPILTSNVREPLQFWTSRLWKEG